MSPISWLLALSALATASAGEAIPWEKPFLEVDGSSLILLPDSSGVIPFRIVLPAGSPFPLRSVQTSCSCYVVGERPPAFQPGQPATVAVTVYTDGSPGPLAGSAWFVGERDGALATIRCRIRAECREFIVWPSGIAPIHLDPATVADGVVERNVALKRGTYPEPWDGLRLDPIAPAQALSLTLERTDAGHWQLKAGIPSARRHGILATVVRVRAQRQGVDLPWTSERLLRLPVQGALTARPSGALIGIVEPGQTVERRLRLTAPAGSCTAVAATPDQPARMACRIDNDGGEQVLVLGFTAPAGSVGPASGSVEVACSDGTTLVVPYLATIAAPRPESSPKP